MKALAISIAMAVFVFAGRAEAGQYNINASSCVPDSSATLNGLHFDVAGTVGFQPGKTGDIILYCPVPYNLGFSPSWISMLYRHDANSASDYIRVQYIKMNVNTGAIGTDASMYSTSSSGTVTAQGTSISTTYSPSAYAYYIRVDIARSWSGYTPVLYLIHLEG